MNELLNAALSYAKKAWPVLPLCWPVDGKCSCGSTDCKPAKHPLIKNGFKAATTDPRIIQSFWAKWPNANIGLVCTVSSGRLVIDIDGREAKDNFKRLVPSLDFDLIPRQRTGREDGGWQLVFQHPGIPVRGQIAGLANVDIKGNGYIVAAPSRHISGKNYIWEIPPLARLPKLPGDLLNAISISGAHAAGYRERFNTAQVLAGVPEGQRDEAIFWLACKLRSADIPQAMAEDWILEAAQNCQPPFSEKVALEKVERAYRNYQPNTGQKNSGARIERNPVTVRLSEVQREKVTWVWKDRIPKGKLTDISGDPGEGKSFLSQAMAAAITTGFGLPGQDEKRQAENVLIMSAEDGLADTIRPRLEDRYGCRSQQSCCPSWLHGRERKRATI